jgi:predicted RNase H-like HicB family nuclease
MRRYKVIIEPDEDGYYIATVPALPGVVDQGDTPDEALERIRGSLYSTLDSMTEGGEPIPSSDVDVFREVRVMELAVYESHGKGR